MAQMKASFLQPMKGLASYADVLIAALVIGIIVIIVVPLHPTVLDLLLSFSLAFSLVILLITMFTTQPLQLSVFPTLLLVTTLLRLSLNISSTRLILGKGTAGAVIEAFGNFVVGGNYVVGMIVFIIITVIQFVVITNGASRVAEVAARFTLDAMPGKQMSIDADLNGGLISEDEARERRKNLQREADFFGSMDGASKFVKGDAIAGIIITLINIFGGFIIGVWQMGKSFPEAIQLYTRLTVGDGLVSQLPALLISTATGILVTRSGSGESFGIDLANQLTAFPKVIYLAGGILCLLGLVPGLPNMPFLILGYALTKEEQYKAAQQKTQTKTKEKTKQPENVLDLFQIDPLEIEIGYSLIPLTDEDQGGDLLERLAAIRRQCAADLGVFVRPIRIRDNLQLDANSYVFKLKGIEVTSGEVMPGYYLAMNPAGVDEPLRGIETREPTFGLTAWWITPDLKDEAELKGFTVVDCTTVLITHLTEFIRNHAAELLGRQEVKEMVETVKESNPAVVEELIPELMSYGEVQKILQNLLAEKIPIRNLVTILEVLADNARLTKDFDYLTEVVRQALKRTISRMYATSEGKMTVITFHPKLEQVIADSLQQTQNGKYPVLSPELTNKLFERIGSMIEQFAMSGLEPIILCSSRIRMPLRRLTERFMPNLVILSLNELTPELDVDSLGTVMLD